jgi:hypothetical protein
MEMKAEVVEDLEHIMRCEEGALENAQIVAQANEEAKAAAARLGA